VAALLFVVGFWLASGVLSAAAYVGAQAWAPPGAGGRAGDFMALTFQARALTCSIRWDVVVQQACSRMREFSATGPRWRALRDTSGRQVPGAGP